MEQETICWNCQNYLKCSWSNGVPVKGWDATPTTITNATGIINSYCVHSCPQFKADAIQRAYIKDIATIIQHHRRTVCRYLASKKKTLELRELLKKKGYILHIYKDVYSDNGETLKTYYLEKVNE